MSIPSILFTPAVGRIIDYLLDHIDSDFSRADVARFTGLSRHTVEKIWPVLILYGILLLTRVIGHARMYAVNEDSKVVQALRQLDLALAMDKPEIVLSRSDENS